MSQNCRVAIVLESNGLNRIFDNNRICAKSFGDLFITSSSSHYFNKTGFERQVFKVYIAVTTSIFSRHLCLETDFWCLQQQHLFATISSVGASYRTYQLVRTAR